MVEEEKKETSEMEKAVKTLSILVSIFLIITLIVIKIYNQDFSLFWFIGIIILILVVGSLVYFSFELKDKFVKVEEEKKKVKKIPKPITLEQAKEIIKQQLLSPEYADYVVGWKQHKIYNVGRDGKTRVLAVQLEKTPYSNKPFQFFIMNMHYPRDLWSYIEQDIFNGYEITAAINKLALTPTKPPSMEKITAEDPLSGRRVVTEKIIQMPKDINKLPPTKPKEDLK